MALPPLVAVSSQCKILNGLTSYSGSLWVKPSGTALTVRTLSLAFVEGCRCRDLVLQRGFPSGEVARLVSGMVYP